jgi:hypothetical protein
MARVVRGKKLEGKAAFALQPMPQLSQHALDRYNDCVGTRIKEFPANAKHYYSIAKDVPMETYSHRLSYDAESILWLLLYWAIQIQPEGGGGQNRMLADLWSSLTTDSAVQPNHDPRMSLVPLLTHKHCHPDYQPLDDLLRSLFEQLFGYQEYTELGPKGAITLTPPEEQSTTRMKADYLHEALQRTLLEFIVVHHTEPFMNLQISSTRRPKEVATQMAPSKTRTKMSRTRDAVEQEDQEWVVEGEGAVEEGASRRKKQKNDHGKEGGRTAEKSPRPGLSTSEYVPRTFSRHVGADIPAGAHQIPNRRKGEGWWHRVWGLAAR